MSNLQLFEYDKKYLYEYYNYVLLYFLQDFKLSITGAYVRFGSNNDKLEISDYDKNLLAQTDIFVEHFSFKKLTHQDYKNPNLFVIKDSNFYKPLSEIITIHNLKFKTNILKGFQNVEIEHLDYGTSTDFGEAKRENEYLELMMSDKIGFLNDKVRMKLLDCADFENRDSCSRANFLDALIQIREKYDFRKEIFVV